jgi:hypothetical protein
VRSHLVGTNARRKSAGRIANAIAKRRCAHEKSPSTKGFFLSIAAACGGCFGPGTEGLRWLNTAIELQSAGAPYLDAQRLAHSETPFELGKFIADETEKWGKVVNFAGIKPD